MRETGGVHAAAWPDLDGAVLKVLEDVGRHNGMDKLIGHLAMHDEDLHAVFVFLSSRASYEWARKAARVLIPMLATIFDQVSRAARRRNSSPVKTGSAPEFYGFAPSLI
jgi:FdhD protein